MKKVITYGTFDLLHNGHINILKRAKALGDYLIVGVTTDNYDRDRGKLNVQNSIMKRIEDVKNTGYADLIIIEEYFGQKIDDIQKYKVDVFAIGSDWFGQFDYLKEFCEVVYLERTKGVSSTQLRNEKTKIVNLGIIGSSRIANNFLKESKYVSGIEIVGCLNPQEKSDLRGFLQNIDAVYVSSPYISHGQFINFILENDKHVLYEKPMGLYLAELKDYYNLAARKSLVLLEVINTAFCPAFNHLVTLIKSNKIGSIKDIETFYSEFSSYPLFPVIKLLGDRYHNLVFYLDSKSRLDSFIHGILQYNKAVASFKTGLGIKTNGSLLISGSKGYAYVPEPWWKTESFELRYDDINQTEKYFYKFNGDGLRYVIHEFIHLIQSNCLISNKLTPAESIAINNVIAQFSQGKGVNRI